MAGPKKIGNDQARRLAQRAASKILKDVGLHKTVNKILKNAGDLGKIMKGIPRPK